MAHRHRLFVRGAVQLVALLVLVGVAAAAGAHTKQETTFPEDGAVLAVAPDVVSIVFDAPMRVTAIQLTNDAGDTFALERSDAMAPITELRATPPPLPQARLRQ